MIIIIEWDLILKQANENMKKFILIKIVEKLDNIKGGILRILIINKL